AADYGDSSERDGNDRGEGADYSLPSNRSNTQQPRTSQMYSNIGVSSEDNHSPSVMVTRLVTASARVPANFHVRRYDLQYAPGAVGLPSHPELPSSSHPARPGVSGPKGAGACALLPSLPLPGLPCRYRIHAWYALP